MQCKGAYHALANDEQCFLRCESLEAPMSQMGHSRPGRGNSKSSYVRYVAEAEVDSEHWRRA
jgi:hypothetical protein